MCVFSLVACAQPSPSTYNDTYDSVAFVDAHWQVDSLDGFLLKRHHFKHNQIFGANQHICMLEIPAGSPRKLAFAYDTVLTEVSTQAERVNALAAVNGTFFDMDEGNPICYLRIDSVEVGENTPGKNDTVNRKYYQYGTMALNNGHPRILHTDSCRFWEERLGYNDVMTAGPLLIHHNKAIPMRDDRTFVTRRHNRTAIGIKADGTIVVMTIDGRFKKESEGMSLNELIRVMQWMGCVEALNLDGGGSTTMYVKGQGEEGVVNCPSDNNRFDHVGERPVSNIIYLL